MTVPLRHFVVGLAFLVAGIGVGIGLHLNAVPGLGRLAHLHLLLAGWICITIMGAMTQFVPVWSGATLHSRRLANVQLGLVVAGLTGFVVAFLRVETAWLIPFATLMLVGFWAFAYNIIRTLATVGEYDVTERHFLGALGFFLALTVLGLLLAIDFTIPTFSPVGVSRSGVVGGSRDARGLRCRSHDCVRSVVPARNDVHADGTTRDRSSPSDRRRDHASDRRGRTRCLSVVSWPTPPALRGSGTASPVGRVGDLSHLGTETVRDAGRTDSDAHAVHRGGRRARAVDRRLGAGLVSDPLTRGHLLGAANAGHLLLLGAIGFVVVGTLYHIIPFVIWVNRYSDLLGLEDVPMIDDLYDDRIAAIDGALLGSGSALIVGSNLLDVAATPALLGGLLVGIGVMAFVFNMVLVLVRHSPHSIDRIVFGLVLAAPSSRSR